MFMLDNPTPSNTLDSISRGLRPNRHMNGVAVKRRPVLSNMYLNEKFVGRISLKSLALLIYTLILLKFEYLNLKNISALD